VIPFTPGFAAPVALAAAALLVLPVIAHLTLRTPTDRVPFGAMMLVQRLVKRLRRRRSLHDRLLLLLRLLAASAALLAVAAPYVAWWDDDVGYSGGGRVVVVLDRSLSMNQLDGGSTLLQRAQGEAATFLRGLPGGARAGLITFAGDAIVRTEGLEADPSRVADLVEAEQPSQEAGDLASALLEARRMLAGEPGEVLVWTDEAGPAMIPAAADELKRLVDGGSAVLPRPVHARPPRNVAVVGARYGGGVEGGTVAVRAVNYGPDPIEVPCEVSLPDGALIPVFLSLPAEGSAEASVTVPRRAVGGVAMARCEDPDLPGDDRRFFHLPSVGASRVLVVDGDPGDSPVKSEVYFLERALAPWGGGHAGVTPDVISPSGLASLDPEVHRLVFMANVSDPRPYGARLRELVRRGGTLVVAMGENVVPERYNEALGPVLPATFRQVRSLADMAEPPVLLEPPDLAPPLFEPFVRSGAAGFRRVGAWRVVTLDGYTESEEVRTLLRYAGGVPALVERTIGDGHVILWTSTFDVGWSNLAFQSVYMPMLQRMVAMYGGDATARAQRSDGVPGVAVRMELPEGTVDVIVEGPEGAAVRSQVEGTAVVFVPERPGGYVVRIADGPIIGWVAVNADVEESDVRRTASLSGAERELRPELFERRAELSGGLAALALLLMVGSAVLARQGRVA
jgi:hypothetical protein